MVKSEYPESRMNLYISCYHSKTYSVRRGITIRILIAPTEIAGQYRTLALALRQQGHSATFVSYGESPFSYGDPNNVPALVQVGRFIRRHAEAHSSGQPRRLLIGIAYVFFSLWGIGAVFRYEAYIFGFGQSLLPFNLDIPLIRLRNKPVIVNMSHGSEIRQPYADGTYRFESGDRRRFARKLCRRSKANHRRGRFLERWASVVVGSPLASSVFLNSPFVNVFSLGKPVEVSSEFETKKLGPDRFRSNKVRVLHAPSNRKAKGSDVIEAIIRELQKDGYPIEYLSLSGVSNAETLRAISSCDFVIDQAYSDIPTPTLTLEACLLGKPAIVGGIHLDHFADYFGGDLIRAIRICKPEELKDAVKALVASAKTRAQMGARARIFAAEFCDPSRVAKNYLRLIGGDIPESWVFDPYSVDYPWGVGQPREDTLENIRMMISISGRQVLGLGARPNIWSGYSQAASTLGVRFEG